jgi:hypothetical protein
MTCPELTADRCKHCCETEIVVTTPPNHRKYSRITPGRSRMSRVSHSSDQIALERSTVPLEHQLPKSCFSATTPTLTPACSASKPCTSSVFSTCSMIRIHVSGLETFDTTIQRIEWVQVAVSPMPLLASITSCLRSSFFSCSLILRR